MTDLKQQILERVSDDLVNIEEALKSNLNPYFDLVKDVAEHIIFSGGKRLRPLLMILSSRVCNYQGDLSFQLSTIFEYLHAATLLHDDIVDEANKRRGKEVANKVWDNATAVLTGDFLLARSLTLAAKTCDPRIIEVMSEITEMMSQGEIQQLFNKGDINLSVEEYMKVIEAKTAVLIRGATRCGALLANSNEDEIERLSRYGMNVGLAFQMADDLLDYTTDSETLGKETGIDLKEGKMTLPVIYTLENAKQNGSSDVETIENIIKNPNFSDDDFKVLIEFMEKHGGISKTIDKAKEHIENAKKQLSVFKNSKDKELLFMIADYALVRKV
ncbi:MAG: polyprenyl synthetase family protein [Desulfobacterales bacterium]|nr:polyprenyl synthetase family protein [Desulfobacterales bacterium]